MLNVSNYTFASNDYGLIGNCDIDIGEYSAMLVELRSLCLKEDFYARDYNFIFQTLVEIAKRHKDSDEHSVAKEDSPFWRFVCKEIGVSQYYQNLYSQFTNVISEMGQRNQIPVVETGNKYYATLMMHAFAPKKSIYSFFDLCYNVFKKDLDFGFTSDDEWLCEIVALEIADFFAKIDNGEKAVSINSNSYWIKIGLRSFALHKGLFGNFVKFTKDIFFNINKLFNREIIEEKTILARYIAQWWENKTENEKVSDSTTRKRRIATVSKQNIVAKYIRDEDRAILCVPPVRLDSEKDTMCLAVYINGEQFCLEEMGTKRGEFVVSTKRKELDLNELLRHSNSIGIQIKITENEAVIYDSKETLNREFILFDDEKEIFRQINKPSNYFIYSLNVDALEGAQKLENDGRLTTCGINLYNIYPNAGEDLKGKTKQVFFVDESKVASLGTNVCLLGSTADVQWKLGDISCVVYKNAVKLMIPESFNLKALELRAYNKCYKLHELNYKHIELNCYQFELKSLGILSECDPAEISFYSYEEEKTILSEILIVLPHLEMQFSSPFYYGDIERKNHYKRRR